MDAADEAYTVPVQAAFNKIGENMKFNRGIKISAAKVGSYLHFNGKVGVLLGVDGELADEMLTDLCMHIAFADPVAITADQVPADVVEKEKQFILDQVMESGKPKEIAEKMVEGKMRKFLSGLALLEQPFVKDDKKKVKDVLGAVNVTAFARFAVGAGA
ncbi:MAG TPA: translation elongation factor Ts [Phycisphaerae bacterium]|nr:translation elongation factor Ts [Phycisphaerae bacterium]